MVNKSNNNNPVKCRRTGRVLPQIWEHTDLDGQFVSALTRERAAVIAGRITGKVLDKDKFLSTGDYAWRERVISTFEEYRRCLVHKEDIL